MLKRESLRIVENQRGGSLFMDDIRNLRLPPAAASRYKKLCGLGTPLAQPV